MASVRSLYHWVLAQAEKPYAVWLLFLMAVIEPCIFPTPPDILLVPIILANRHKAYRYAAICTLGSLTGALIGYGIGAFLMATLGRWIVDTYHLQDAFEHSRQGFEHWGTLLIIGKASVPLIPVPFFLVVIASGAFHFSIVKLLGAVAAVRVTRFLVEAALLARYGEPIRVYIEKHLNWLICGAVALVIVWVLITHSTL